MHDNNCDRCGTSDELYHNEATGMAVCAACDIALDEAEDTYPEGFRVRDAKAIRSFVHSTATYKSGRYCQLKGEAYDSGNRLARYYGADRPMDPIALAALAACEGIVVDTELRLRKLTERAVGALNVANATS